MVAENLVQSPWKSRFGVFAAIASPLPKPQLILKTSRFSLLFFALFTDLIEK